MTSLTFMVVSLSLSLVVPSHQMAPLVERPLRCNYEADRVERGRLQMPLESGAGEIRHANDS